MEEKVGKNFPSLQNFAKYPVNVSLALRQKNSNTTQTIHMAWVRDVEGVDHFTVVAKLPGLRIEVRLPVALL